MAEKILVVEDENSIRNHITQFLNNAGYETREAANGAEALEMLSKEHFNLVITDLVMPHVDGIRLVESIHAKWPHIPALLLTAYLSARAGNTILRDRAEVIDKPVKFAELVQTVKRVLGSNHPPDNPVRKGTE